MLFFSRLPLARPVVAGDALLTLDRLLLEEIVRHHPDALMRRCLFYNRLQILQYERPGLDIYQPPTQPLDILPRPATHVDKQRDVRSPCVEKPSRREQIRPGCLRGGVGGHDGLENGHVGGLPFELVEAREAAHVLPIRTGCVGRVRVLHASEKGGQVGVPGEGGVVAFGR